MLELLAAAARAIRANDCLAALEHLLTAYATLRSHALCAPIDACARRASRWQRPWIAHGSEHAIWRMQAAAANAADLTLVLEAVPERAGELIEQLASQRERPDPRLAHALLEIASGKRRAYLRRCDWSSLFRGIARHGDDAALDELARVKHTVDADARIGYAGLVLPPSPRELEPAEREAIADIERALADTPARPEREALSGVAPHLREALQAIACGGDRDAAFAWLEARHAEILASAFPTIEQLLRLGPAVDRRRLLRLLGAPWRQRDFFEKYPDLDGELAQRIDDGWGTYIVLMADPDPEVAVAALHLCAHLFIPARDSLMSWYRERAAALGDPLARAAFLVAAGRADRDHRERPTEWPLDDPHPVVAFAAATCEALARGAWVTREALALLETPPAPVDARRFPWFGGDLPAMARAIIAWLQQPPIEATLEELERRIREGASTHDDTTGEWRARNLVPRVFGRHFDREALTPQQQRLVPVLAFYRSKELERLRIAPPPTDATRRALGIAGRTLKLAPSISLDEWTPAHEQRFGRYHSAETEIPAIRCIVERGRTIGLDIRDDISGCVGALEHSGVLALKGGEPLARWIASGHRCDTVRVLELHAIPAEIADELARAPLVRQLRRLILRTGGPAVERLLASPHLARLEALQWYGWSDPRPLVGLSHLRELALLGPRTATMDELADALARMMAPLEKLVLAGEVPVDALAGNDAFAIHELAIEGALLRGAEVLGALRELRVLRAAGSSFDDAAASALATCRALETADLARTRIADEGAAALAQLPRLATLDLRETAVRDLGVVERLARAPAMTTLALPWRTRLELWLRGRALPAVALPTDDERARWVPQPVEDELELHGEVAEVFEHARACGAWPEPPTGFGRLFVVERDVPCDLCRGRGVTPEGHCPNHADTEEIRHVGPLPHEANHARRFARAAHAVEIAEGHAAALASAMAARGLGAPRTIAWRFDRDDWHAIPVERGAIDELAGDRLGETLLWPYEGDDPVSRAAAAILDAGFSVVALGSGEIHLGFHERPR